MPFEEQKNNNKINCYLKACSEMLMYEVQVYI